MFERRKLEKEATKLYNLLKEKASDEESIVSLSCSIYLFSGSNIFEYISHNKYTRTECLLYMAEVYNKYIDFFETPFVEKQLDTDAFYEYMISLSDINRDCINHTMIDYLGYSMEEFKKFRRSRSNYYYNSTKGFSSSNGFNNYVEVVTTAFADLLSFDIYTNNPLEVDNKTGKLLVPFDKMMKISIEAKTFSSFTIKQIEKALTPEFHKAGLIWR